jgi:leader peptidase (prepilin peptidase)/N-methyltransferase
LSRRAPPAWSAGTRSRGTTTSRSSRTSCRSCGTRIPLRYPAVELVAALLFAACFWKFGLSGSAFVGAFFCLTLVAVSATDLEHRIIPNRIVVPAGLIVLLANTALHPGLRWTVAAFGAAGFLFAAALAYPGGMGMGDVKLAFLMGAALGSSVAPGMFIGMLAALVPGFVLIAKHGKRARKMGVPFGPFLALGSVVALFAGPWLVHLYFGSFHV